MHIGETITRNNNVEQAMDCRDATAKVWRFLDFIWRRLLLKSLQKQPSKRYVQRIFKEKAAFSYAEIFVKKVCLQRQSQMSLIFFKKKKRGKSCSNLAKKILPESGFIPSTYCSFVMSNFGCKD